MDNEGVAQLELSNGHVVRRLINSIYGEVALKVLDYVLTHNGVIIEEFISQDLGIKSNEGRRALQKMSEEALFSPVKIKDGDRILHGWALNHDALRAYFQQRAKKAISKLETLLSYVKESPIYVCPVCKRMYTVEEAYANDFLCENDGELLKEIDSGRLIKFLEEKIALLRRAVEEAQRNAGK
ncbi:MAG: transcription factor TFIIE [Desulfurococcaceae archaeon]